MNLFFAIPAILLAALLISILVIAHVRSDLLIRLERLRIQWLNISAILLCLDLVLWISTFARLPSPPPRPVWIAATHLAAGTRLTATHLKQPAFPNPWSAQSLPDRANLVGRYLRTSREAGQIVLTGDLARMPVLRQHPGQAILFLPTQSLGSAAASLNAGDHVLVCEEAKPCTASPLYVEAVVGETTAPLAAVRVRQQDIEAVRAITKPILVLASLSEGETTCQSCRGEK